MKKADFLIIGLAALLSLLPLLGLLGSREAERVTITQSGETVYTGPLSKDAVVELPGNVVQIRGGVVTMRSADCPDGLCITGGPATLVHPLVCLPHQLIVTVTGEEATDLDGVAY